MPDHPASVPAARRAWRRAMAIVCACAAAACGGGGAGAGAPPPSYVDANVYSTAPAAGLATPSEATAVTHGQVRVGEATIAYTATAGHLTARRAEDGTPEASFFYVSYTADGADPATRPVTVFFNGGPGSSTAWLHLGSFAPRRLATGVPALTQAAPFPYVDNAESLLDTTDLVFVDAVGTGLSEAVLPFTNQSFWGVDADAASFRDFTQRYLAAAGRTASPLFLFGESYGTVRASVLALLLESAGQPVRGVILQSSILDYHVNCWNYAVPTVSCDAFLPSYAATGSFFGLVNPPPPALGPFMDSVRVFADDTYAPAATAWLATRALPDEAVFAQLVADTGLAEGAWRAQFDMDADTFRHALRAGQVSGIYDGRMAAPDGSALARDDDPSNTFIEGPFASAMQDVLAHTLGFTTPSAYVLSSGANLHWVFTHGGNAMPDVVPDLAAAMVLDPDLRVLSVNGVHDLITPFHRTELDLARLGDASRIDFRFYAGGHMTYLDDQSRPIEKADLQAFYARAGGAR